MYRKGRPGILSAVHPDTKGTQRHETRRDKARATRHPDTCANGGRIAAVSSPGQPDYRKLEQTARAAGKLEVLSAEEYLLPGLVDTHVHAPQWPQLGKALDRPLDEWLMNYTFPLEARYADTDFARRVY